MSRLTFFSGTKNASSWAMRAWLALRAAGIDFEEVVVDIRRPQRFMNLDVVRSFSPTGMVPALLVDNRVIFDSVAIMEFANDWSGGRLLPETALDRAQARSLLAWQHSGLSAMCSRISFESAFYPYKRRLTAQEVAELPRLFDWLEPLLARSGGPFLFGEASLADFALTPTVIRLWRHSPDLSRWPAVEIWARCVLSHPLVSEWLSEADRLPHIWFDEYLPEGEPRKLLPCPYLGLVPIHGETHRIQEAAPTPVKEPGTST